MAAGGGLARNPEVFEGAPTAFGDYGGAFFYNNRTFNNVRVGGGTREIYSTARYVSVLTRPQTPEEIEAAAQARAAWEQRDAEMRGASERADALLKERLGAWRYRLFASTGKLMRPSKVWPGVEYLIARDAKVKVVRGGKVTQELCVVNRAQEPEDDRIMAILDLIETDERHLWEMANIFPPS